jgi:hypothetical protein
VFLYSRAVISSLPVHVWFIAGEISVAARSKISEASALVLRSSALDKPAAISVVHVGIAMPMRHRAVCVEGGHLPERSASKYQNQLAHPD